MCNQLPRTRSRVSLEVIDYTSESDQRIIYEAHIQSTMCTVWTMFCLYHGINYPKYILTETSDRVVSRKWFNCTQLFLIREVSCHKSEQWFADKWKKLFIAPVSWWNEILAKNCDTGVDRSPVLIPLLLSSCFVQEKHKEGESLIKIYNWNNVQWKTNDAKNPRNLRIVPFIVVLLLGPRERG